MDKFADFAYRHIKHRFQIDKSYRQKYERSKRSVSLNLLEQHPHFRGLLFALFYRLLGWSVIPVGRGTKRALVKWKEYQDRLPDYDELYAWFYQCPWPDPNFGLILGPVSDVFAIDVDGVDAHNVLSDRVDIPAGALKSISGSREPDRYHLLFRNPAIETASKYTPWHEKLEFRGNRGLVILPPSLHKSGHCYEWKCKYEHLLEPLPSAPPPVLKELKDKIAPKATVKCRNNKVRHPRVISSVRQDDRGSTSLVGDLRLCKTTRRFLLGIFAYCEGWNSRLFNAACDLAANGVPYDTAITALLRGAKPETEEDQENAVRTIESAYSEDRIPGHALFTRHN